jgi:hypothetical protein
MPWGGAVHAYDVPVDNTLNDDAILDETARFVLVRVDAGFEIRSTGDGDEPLMTLSGNRHDEEQARSAFRRLIRQERLAISLVVLAATAGMVWLISRLALDIPGFIHQVPLAFDPFSGYERAFVIRDWLQLIVSTSYDVFLVATVMYVILWLQRRWWLERGET